MVSVEDISVDDEDLPVTKLVNLVNLKGERVRYEGAFFWDGDNRAYNIILDCFVNPLDASKVIKHQILSAGLTVPELNLTSLVLTLERGSQGAYIMLLTEPKFTPPNIIFHRPHIFTEGKFRKSGQAEAENAWEKIREFVKNGNYRLHVSYTRNLGLEEIR
jgi:hypothetical protein